MSAAPPFPEGTSVALVAAATFTLIGLTTAYFMSGSKKSPSSTPAKARSESGDIRAAAAVALPQAPVSPLPKLEVWVERDTAVAKAEISMVAEDFKDEMEVLRDFARNFAAEGTIVVCTGKDCVPSALPSFQPPSCPKGDVSIAVLQEHKKSFSDQLRQHILDTHNVSSPIVESTTIKLITVNPLLKAAEHFKLMPMVFQPRFMLLLIEASLHIVQYGFVAQDLAQVKKVPGLTGQDSQYTNKIIRIVSENLIDRDYSITESIANLNCAIFDTNAMHTTDIMEHDATQLVQDPEGLQKFLYFL